MVSLQVIRAASPFFLLILKALNENPETKDAYDFYFDRLKDKDLSDFAGIIMTKIDRGPCEPRLVCVTENKIAYKELASRAVRLAPPGTKLVVKGSDLEAVYKMVIKAIIHQNLINIFKIKKSVEMDSSKSFFPPTIEVDV